MRNIEPKYLIFAHGIHSGGGWTLLESLWKWIELNDAIIILDLRSKKNIPEDLISKCYFFSSSIAGRLLAEKKLKRIYSKKMKVLSFNSLPFLIFRPKKYFLFFQNVDLISPINAGIFSKRAIKKLLLRLFFSKNIFFLVQTNTVERKLHEFFSNKPLQSLVIPFLDLDKVKQNAASSESLNRRSKDIEYIYPADGSPHKNHKNLILALIYLKSSFNLQPKLYLTLNEKYESLQKWITKKALEYDLAIENIGTVSRDELLDRISNSKALIYPSIHESFGLPLIEARYLNVDIIASESDYVRDVCVPNETFSPSSYISIARAIIRYESQSNLHMHHIIDGNSFMNRIFKD